MRKVQFLTFIAVGAFVLAMAPSSASAWWWHKKPHPPSCPHIPDSTGSMTQIADPTPPIPPCFGAPAFTVEKSFEVWAPHNCGNPRPVSGAYTYVYKLRNVADSCLDIIAFTFDIDPSVVIETGSFDGDGVMPDAVVDTSSGVVTYTWSNRIAPGQTSTDFFMVSAYQPGEVPDVMTTTDGAFSTAAEGLCVGASQLPEPLPCSSFFWRLKAKSWKWLHHYFPFETFEEVLDQGVSLSQGIFSNRKQLVRALTRSTRRSVAKKAKREYAAVLLNVASGELFPANTKCRLFNDTPIDLDGDMSTAESTVGAEIVNIAAAIVSGDTALLWDAKHTAVEINLGMSPIGSAVFQ